MLKLLKFGASYCAPCRAMAPILEELKSKIDIQDIDVDEADPVVLTNYKIRNIPVLVLLKDDKEVWRHVGSISKSDLEKEIENMKLIKPYFEIIEQESGLEGIYKQIELAGRTCYKSEDKITPDSAKGFVDRMIKSGHGAMLEHGTVYLKADSEFYNPFIQPEDGEEEEYNDLFKYGDNNYSVCHEQRSVNGNTIYVTTNLRVLVENNWLDDLKYLCEPTEYHEKRITVKFICDRGVSHEFVRHKILCVA